MCWVEMKSTLKELKSKPSGLNVGDVIGCGSGIYQYQQDNSNPWSYVTSWVKVGP